MCYPPLDTLCRKDINQPNISHVEISPASFRFMRQLRNCSAVVQNTDIVILFVPSVDSSLRFVNWKFSITMLVHTDFGLHTF